MRLRVQPGGASNSLPLWENNSCFLLGGGGKLLALERNYSGFGLQHRELEKKICVSFPVKISNWSGFFPNKPIHSTFTDIL